MQRFMRYENIMSVPHCVINPSAAGAQLMWTALNLHIFLHPVKSRTEFKLHPGWALCGHAGSVYNAHYHQPRTIWSQVVRWDRQQFTHFVNVCLTPYVLLVARLWKHYRLHTVQILNVYSTHDSGTLNSHENLTIYSRKHSNMSTAQEELMM